MKLILALLSSTLLVTGCWGSVAPTPIENDPTTAEAASDAARRRTADPNDVWLAFDVAASSKSEVHVMRADGKDRRRLDLGMEASAPAFSRNGRALAFAGPNGIWVKDLPNGQLHQVTHGQDGTPAWSPDGKHLAFTRNVDIFVVGVDGMGERSYIHGPPPGQAWYSNYGHPVFAVDGQSLIFGHRGGIDQGNLDGSGVHPLFVAAELDIAMATVSPDGTQIAINSNCGVRVTPFASAAKACDVGTKLGGGPGGISRPAWSSNGLVAYVDGWYRINLVPEAGGTPLTILDTKQSLGGAYVNEVSWSPPGTVIP